MTTVVCVKQGDWYGLGAEYVNRLFAGIERNITRDVHYLCLTEDATGIDWPCREFTDPTLPGWWQKVALFDGTIDDHIMFFDLDTVIVGNIDFMFPPWTEGLGFPPDKPMSDFAALRGAYQPFRFGSGIMHIPKGVGRNVWQEFAKDPYWAMHYCGNLGDGHWMQLCMGSDVTRWQDRWPGKFASFKVDCAKRQYGDPPEGAAVVYFHGQPRPHEVQSLPFMLEHWTDEWERAVA